MVLIFTATYIIELVTMMILDVWHTITEWLHSIQLDGTTEDRDPMVVPVLALPQIDTKKVLSIGFQNAHGVHPIDAHDKCVEAMEMENAQKLQIGSFGVSELNTNVHDFPVRTGCSTSKDFPPSKARSSSTGTTTGSTTTTRTAARERSYIKQEGGK